MYASVQHLNGPAPDRATNGADSAPLGSVVLRSADGVLDAVIAFWATDDQARRAAGGAYVVVDSHEGPAVAEPPTHAMVLWFDGPRSAAQAAADQLAGTRIAPTVRDVPGVVGTWILRADDLGMVTVSLTTSRDAPAAVEHAVMSSELLPEEDASLLSGPDRAAVLAVERCDLPRIASSTAGLR